MRRLPFSNGSIFLSNMLYLFPIEHGVAVLGPENVFCSFLEEASGDGLVVLPFLVYPCGIAEELVEGNVVCAAE